MVDYNTYEEISRLAVIDDNVFNTFKHNWSYTYMLEQHWPGTEHIGFLFVNKLETKYKNILCSLPWKKYQENDSLGGPNIQECRNFEKYINLPHYNFSHTTLRYILTSLNIIFHLQTKFGSFPESINIIEIGGGYGGQCKIMIDTLNHYNIKYNYTIIDLESPSLLQRKYLDRLNINNVTCSTSTNYQKDINYDLCISTYTIGEIPLDIQTEYVKNIILKCKSAYMLWNVSPINPLIMNTTVRPESPVITESNKTVTF